MSNFADNRERWAVLVRRISSLCNRTQHAEDLLQSAFIKMREYQVTTEVRNESAFLVRTATNLWVDDCRKRSWETPFSTVKGYCEIEDESPLQDEVFASRERVKRVREGLKAMPPGCRRVFLMHRVDGLKYREIAQQLKITQSAVEKHIARAQQFLTDWVDGW